MGSVVDIRGVARRAGNELTYVTACARAGILRPEPPQRAALALRDVARYGFVGALPALAARRAGDRAAVIDERGSLTFAELDHRANALGNAWRARGLRAGDGVAILVRNHRGFLDALFAAAKCGARIVLLNTDFSGPQVREVAEREGATLLVHDDEYAAFLEGIEPRLGRWRAWTDDAGPPAPDTLEALIAEGSPAAPPRPAAEAKIVVLTSGTTGTPKGAPRTAPKSLMPIGVVLSMVPFRSGETTVVAAPLFHALGFLHGLLAGALCSTLVLRRRFDPEAMLDDMERHRATAAVVVPVMLRRLLAVQEGAPERRDLSALRILFVSGSQLGAALCERATEAFGPVVYNLYGSTEVAAAAIARPADLAVAPGCVGTCPPGVEVRLYDEQDRPVEAVGRTGRIFVGNGFQFEGYTGGGTKEMIDGLMSSGDVGHFDAAGRLFVDGRDDDMIVSGGENVFPAEIEELLHRHDAIVEAALIAVDDEQWGQRLRAFVVLDAGARLSEDDVKGHVRENLARYKVPREVVFLDELPRNPSGKVLKRELALIVAPG